MTLANSNHPAPTEAALQAQQAELVDPTVSQPQDECNREFDFYEQERGDVKKAELDADRAYDTSTSTIAALAIGLSLTVFKDFLRGPDVIWLASIALAWICFSASLLSSLWHRKLTYDTHKAWREAIDREFTDWRPGARERALECYDKIRGIKMVEHLKPVAFFALVAGIFLLTIFLVANVLNKETPNGVTEAAAVSDAAASPRPISSDTATERPDSSGTSAAS